MMPGKYLSRQRQSYNVCVRTHIIRVAVKKKCFIIRRSPPAVPGCRNKVNRLGNLTIGFGHGRSTRVHATLAQAERAWKLVLSVLGITANDLRSMAAETDEEELFGSDIEGSLNSDSSGYSDMPPLMDAPVTAAPPSDEPISSTDADSSSTDEEPEAMQVTAGSSTDQPGNTHAGSILPVGEEPMYLPPTTSLHQPNDASMISQTVTTGSGPGDFDFHILGPTGYYDTLRYFSLSRSHTAMGWSQLGWPSTRQRYTLMTPVSSQLPLPAGMLPSVYRYVRSRVETLRLYEAAPIAVQPDSLVMLTQSDEPLLASMTARGSPCRECVSWHKPYFLRFLLAQWRNVAEVNRHNRWANSRAHSVNKKPRFEYF